MNRRDFLKMSGLGALVLTNSSCGYQMIKTEDLEKMLVNIGEKLDKDDLERRIKQIEEKKKVGLRKHIRGIKENIVTASSMGLVNGKIKIPKKDGTYESLEYNTFFEIKGEGLIVEDYFITVNHVVSLNEENHKKDYFRSNGYFPIKVKILKEQTFLENEKLEAIFKEKGSIDGGRDMAIFKLPKNYKKSDYVVRLGDSDKLELYDEVHLLGDPKDFHFAPRPGVISNLKEDYYSNMILSKGKSMAVVGIGGDSGSPIMNKNGEVIGIAALSDTATVIFVPINEYKKEIEKYETEQKVLQNIST